MDYSNCVNINIRHGSFKFGPIWHGESGEEGWEEGGCVMDTSTWGELASG